MRRLVMVLGLTASIPALAAEVKICTVDAERAINETAEGKEAQSRLETMYASKQAEIERRQQDLEREFKDFESRQMILSDEARQAQEQALWEKRQEFQGLLYQAEQDMQQTYMSLLADLQEKLLGVAEALGETRGCTLLLNQAAVIYTGAGVVDLTEALIKEYDARK